MSLEEYEKKDLTNQDDIDSLENELIFYSICGI